MPYPNRATTHAGQRRGVPEQRRELLNDTPVGDLLMSSVPAGPAGPRPPSGRSQRPARNTRQARCPRGFSLC
jgi:hypothetical protein